jgi:uracil-DNA glycosylase
MTEVVTKPRIVIVGEAWGEAEEAAGEPFVGPSGQVLNSLLRAAGLPREAAYLTNVFNLHPPQNRLENLGASKSFAIEGWPQLSQKLWISREYQPELTRLFEELSNFQPNLVIALGATPLWALCKQTGIKKFRGTPLMSFDGKYKVLPTYHPSAVMRQWKLRPVVIADLQKAVRESASKQLVRPKRIIHLEPTLADIEDFYTKYIEPADSIACDIETKQLTITEVGFGTPDRALVIPFYKRQGSPNYWPTLSEELEAWAWVRRILAEKPIDGQNFSYDFQYFWLRMGIPVRRVGDDTMILHHAMYPEMEKSLGFLGSIYTDEPSWKFMRTDHDNFKRED